MSANIRNLGRKNAGIEKIYWMVPASTAVSRRMGTYLPADDHADEFKSTANLSLAKRNLASLITLCWQTRVRVIGFSRGCNFLTSHATMSSVGQCIILLNTLNGHKGKVMTRGSLTCFKSPMNSKQGYKGVCCISGRRKDPQPWVRHLCGPLLSNNYVQ